MRPIRLPDGDGFELVPSTAASGLPVAVITAFGSIETAIRALKLVPDFSHQAGRAQRRRLRELVAARARFAAVEPVEHGAASASVA